MMPESGPEEVVIIEEQVRPAPAGRRAASPARIAGMVLGSLAFSLAATTVAIRLANRGRGSPGRRRTPLLNVQPRAAIFAPNITINLPFSGVAGRAVRGRPAQIRAVRFPRRGRPMGARVPSQASREMAGPRRWLSRPARRPAAR